MAVPRFFASRWFLRVLAVAIVLGAGVAESNAQGINPFGRAPASLKDSEMPLIMGSFDRVLQEYKVGATADWKSGETGRSGQVVITQIFQRNGWRCAQVTHRVTSGGEGTFT